MKVITELEKLQIDEPTAVILGKFDGVHRGHRTLIEAAKESGRKTVVFTFLFGCGRRNLLTENEERRLLLMELGIDYLVECPFESIQDMEPEQFIDEVVIQKLNAELMVAGTDCGFGKNRRGNAALAEQRMAAHGKKAVIIPKLLYGVQEISSSYIREELGQGNLEVANYLLGYEYFFCGTVVGGNQIGRTLNFPTLNLHPGADKALPPFGVYASKVWMEGKFYQGVTNIGVKPTVGSKEPCVETYLLDYQGDAYGKKIKVSLERFIRPERKFESLDELKGQIKKDIESVRA